MNQAMLLCSPSMFSEDEHNQAPLVFPVDGQTHHDLVKEYPTLIVGFVGSLADVRCSLRSRLGTSHHGLTYLSRVPVTMEQQVHCRLSFVAYPLPSNQKPFLHGGSFILQREWPRKKQQENAALLQSNWK